MLLDTIFAVSGADGQIGSLEIQRLQTAAAGLQVDDVLVSALIQKHDPRHLNGELKYSLAGDRIVIGRSHTCDICLPDPQVALRHTELIRSSGKWRAVDMGSGRPTMVGGSPVTSARWKQARTRHRFLLLVHEERSSVCPHGPTLSSLSIRDLNRKIGDIQLLEDVSFTVFTGEVVAVIGPSGCGKRHCSMPSMVSRLRTAVCATGRARFSSTAGDGQVPGRICSPR